MSNAEVRGRFVWHELLTSDTAAAAGFYAKVVGWRSQPSNMPGYTIFMSGQIQIAGLMALPPEAGSAPPHWIVYVGTPDVDACCEQAQGLGGRIHKPPTDIPNVGRFAVLADPQGAVFALFSPQQPAPPDGGTPAGVITWYELATSDVEGALRFYGTVCGWRESHRHEMGDAGQYVLFGADPARPFGGVYALPGRAAWLFYFHVDDLEETAARVRMHHGQVLRGPMEVPGGDRIVVCVDPQGAPFALHATKR